MGESQAYLPDTQPATQPLDDDCFDLVHSQTSSNMEYWGRLYPARRTIRAHDLNKNEVSVGRCKTCEATIYESEVTPSMWVVISKRHFSIIRMQEEVMGCSTTKIMVKDLSMNGTFINGKKLGRGRTCVLSHNDVIAVAKPQFKMFYYLEFDSTVFANKFPYVVNVKYDISGRLGSGAFGEVHLVFNKENRRGYAMKTIQKDNITSDRKRNVEVQKLENEIKILTAIKHPNVIQLVDTVDCLNEKYLILQFMEGKDLYDRITTLKRLTESQAKLYFYQIACGVKYLHEHGIVHRDLKPENVLLATDDIETVVKITDFGLSKVLNSHTYMDSLCGTKMYVAPEILIGGGAMEYTGLVDVWSMGVILYVSLSGSTPFANERNRMTMEEQIKKGFYTMPPNRWECISLNAKKLVRRMMNVRPDQRTTLAEMFEHPWLMDNSMKSKVAKLISEYETLNDNQEVDDCEPLIHHLEISDKENVPSPLPGTMNLSSSCMSPPRKRGRMDFEQQL